MYEFFQAAFPWILLGLFVAVSCAFFPEKNVRRCHLAHMPTNSIQACESIPTGLRMVLVLFRSAFCLAMSS